MYVIFCEDCIHYEETFRNKNRGGGYCHYWDYGQGLSPNSVNIDDFCSNAELNLEKVLNDVKDEIYKEHGAMPINLLEQLAKDNPKVYTEILNNFYHNKNINSLVNKAYKYTC